MNTVVLPVKCEHCGSPLTLECNSSSGFGYMSPGWFRCPDCREVNRCAALPGKPVAITKAVEMTTGPA